jgi:hypothetical protein
LHLYNTHPPINHSQPKNQKLTCSIAKILVSLIASMNVYLFYTYMRVSLKLYLKKAIVKEELRLPNLDKEDLDSYTAYSYLMEKGAMLLCWTTDLGDYQAAYKFQRRTTNVFWVYLIVSHIGKIYDSLDFFYNLECIGKFLI